MDTIGLREVTALDMTLDKFTRTSGTRSPVAPSMSLENRRDVAQMRHALPSVISMILVKPKIGPSLSLSLCQSLFLFREQLMWRPLVSTRCRRQERFGPRKFQSRVLHHTPSDPMELIDDQIDLTSISYTRPSWPGSSWLVVSVIEVNDYQIPASGAPARISVFLFLMRLSSTWLDSRSNWTVDGDYFFFPLLFSPFFSFFFFFNTTLDLSRFSPRVESWTTPRDEATRSLPKRTRARTGGPKTAFHDVESALVNLITDQQISQSPLRRRVWTRAGTVSVWQRCVRTMFSNRVFSV